MCIRTYFYHSFMFLKGISYLKEKMWRCAKKILINFFFFHEKYFSEHIFYILYFLENFLNESFFLMDFFLQKKIFVWKFFLWNFYKLIFYFYDIFFFFVKNFFIETFNENPYIYSFLLQTTTFSIKVSWYINKKLKECENKIKLPSHKYLLLMDKWKNRRFSFHFMFLFCLHNSISQGMPFKCKLYNTIINIVLYHRISFPWISQSIQVHTALSSIPSSVIHL